MSTSDLAKEEKENGRIFQKPEAETTENYKQMELLKNQSLIGDIL